jgi:hypothetical protein
MGRTVMKNRAWSRLSTRAAFVGLTLQAGVVVFTLSNLYKDPVWFTRCEATKLPLLLGTILFAILSERSFRLALSLAAVVLFLGSFAVMETA